MLKAYAFGFYEVALQLEKLRTLAELRSGEIDKYDAEAFQTVLGAIQTECVNLGLNHTLNLSRGIGQRFQEKMRDDWLKYKAAGLSNDLGTLNISFINELREELIFRIAPNRKDYFEKDDLFGSAVSTAFPSSIDEIRSAGNCFAIEQWDACAFHLMRVLERGLGVLATKFKVPFEHTNWHNVIEQVEAAVRKMDSSFGADWKEQQKFYSQAASQFMFFKDAWRNHVMHARDVYDEGKALSIFNHVDEFMKALAEGGLSE